MNIRLEQSEDYRGWGHKEKTAQQMPCGFIWFEII